LGIKKPYFLKIELPSGDAAYCIKSNTICGYFEKLSLFKTSFLGFAIFGSNAIASTCCLLFSKKAVAFQLMITSASPFLRAWFKVLESLVK